MSAGVQIFNDQNKIQIDQDYQNLFLINKVVRTGITISSMYYFARTSNTSLIAVSVTPRFTDTAVDLSQESVLYPGNVTNSANAAVGGMSVMIATIDGTTNIQVTLLAGTNFVAPPGGVTLTFYEFDTIQQINETSGFLVYAADGSVVFDGYQKPLKVVDFFTIPVAYIKSVPINGALQTIGGYEINDRALPRTDRQYAVVYLNETQTYTSQFESISSGVVNYYNSTGFIQFFMQTNSLRLINRRVYPYIADDYSQGMYSVSNNIEVMLIDVTNY